MNKELLPQLISYQQNNTQTLTDLLWPAPHVGTMQAVKVNLLSRNLSSACYLPAALGEPSEPFVDQ